uniref:F-box protein AT5G49610-like beta-propeller domain-containing protein n=1 Tax=Setaria viridis TaxID=4556 RepID=A0A4U6WAG8_SETVI|nr:hypothetical protein SEVIR_1G174800v2 [Setaria viridis]
MGRTERKRSGPAAAVPAAVASVLGNDVLLAEILLRLDLPTWLVRAALVSRRWFRGASDPAFLRHFRALHPPRVLALHANAVGFGRGETRCLPPPRSNPGSLLRDKRGTCEGSLLRLLENDADSTSCLFLNLRYNDEELAAEFSLLQSGVWGVARSTVTELPQRIFDTMVAHKLLVGRKFYMTTALGGYILGLDLVTASFFTVQLPADIWNSTSFRLSRPQQSGLYLIDAKGFQLQVCRGDGMGQWALVDTISVPKVCGHLNVRRWVPDDAQTAPVSVLAAGENAEFVFLELVASGIVCCIQLSNRAVERVGVGLRMTEDFIRPLTMVWPPVFPVLN